MQCVGKLVDESSDVFLVGRIELLPIDHHSGGLRVAQNREHIADKSLLSILRPMRQVLNCFRLPRIADQISQQRHECDAFARSELRHPRIRVDLQIPHAINNRHPFRADMGDLRRMLLERRVTVRIAICVKREPYFIVRRFFAGARRGRRLWAAELFRRLSGLAKFLPEQRTRRKLPRRIFLLQCFQLAFQLPQRKRNSHFRRNKKRLDKEHRPEKKEHSRDEQNQS